MSSPKLKAVCRAEGRGERRRCAVRMTAKGSVTPGMACGSRPVERIPELGAFPTVGIRPGPGLPRGRLFPPWPAPANGRLANRSSRQGGTGSNRIQIWVSTSTIEGENRHAVRMTAKGSVTPGMACGSRPVERIPELGAFPTVGINPGPGLPRGRPFPPWPAPANGRLAHRPSRQGGTGSSRAVYQPDGGMSS